MGRRYIVEHSDDSRKGLQGLLDSLMREHPTGRLFSLERIPERQQGGKTTLACCRIVLEVDDA